MAFAKDTYTSSGEATYSITFPYLNSDHILLFVNGVSATYTLDSATVLRPDTTPTSGDTVVIERSSNRTARIADYADASVLKAQTLDDDVLQAFYVSQEAFDTAADGMLLDTDDEFDANSKEIKNLTGGTDNNDAVAYAQMVNYVAAAAGVPAPPGTAGLFLVDNGGAPAWSTDEARYLIQDATATAAAGPVLELHRNSASPAASDVIGQIKFDGEDDASAQVTYVYLDNRIVDPAAATFEGEHRIYVATGGSLGLEATYADGMSLGASLLPQGAGTLNASAIYDDGVALETSAAIRSADAAWTGSQRSTFNALTDAATIAVDCNAGNNHYVTVTADRTMGDPSNKTDGQAGYIIVEQDGTGGHTTSWHANYDFGQQGTPVVNEAANTKSLFGYVIDWDSTFKIRHLGDF